MTDINCKLLVVGGGPGGYVCAIRAGQLGIDTVLVEGDKLGGSCLNVGCIPSKALIHVAGTFENIMAASRASTLGISCAVPTIELHKAVTWKNGIVQRLNTGVSSLLRKSRVEVVRGWARFKDGKSVVVTTETGPKEIRAESIVIATGSAPIELPFLPFGGAVISSTEALGLTELPRRLTVIGAGYIGLELGVAFAKLGSQVTIIESGSKILPVYDEELTTPVSAKLKRLGVRVLTETQARSLGADGSLAVVNADHSEEMIASDKILVTVGRKPQTHAPGMEGLVLDMDGPFIRVSERCETSMRGLFAVGDVTGEPMLAHRAMAQGEMVAEIIAGRARRVWDKRSIPAICFTDPEIVSVGIGPERACTEIVVGQFPFAANGRAMTLEDDTGFVRIVAHGRTHEILGIQAVGSGVSELSAAFSLAIETGSRLEDVGAVIHAHPTLSEAFQEAALKAQGKAIH